MGDSFLDAVDKINVKIDRLRKKNDDSNAPERIPPTVQHATGEICLEGADLLSRDAILQGDVPAGKNYKEPLALS